MLVVKLHSVVGFKSCKQGCSWHLFSVDCRIGPISPTLRRQDLPPRTSTSCCARISTPTIRLEHAAHRWPMGADVSQCPLFVCAPRMGTLGGRRIARQLHDRSVLRGQPAANHGERSGAAGGQRLAFDDSVWIEPWPGHTPGHVCVIARSPRRHRSRRKGAPGSLRLAYAHNGVDQRNNITAEVLMDYVVLLI